MSYGFVRAAATIEEINKVSPFLPFWG